MTRVRRAVVGGRTEDRVPGSGGPRPRTSDLGLLLRHERIAIVARRREGFLHGALADPAHEVQLGSGLVVRARSTRAAERLLANNGAGGLVVDVEVASRVTQRAQRLPNTGAVAAEDRAGQRVGRRLVDGVECL